MTGALQPTGPSEMEPTAPTVDPQLLRTLASHPFAEDLDERHVRVLADHARAVDVAAGGFVFEHGATAELLYLLTDGDVALEIARPGRPPLVLETLHPGDTLGWSWLFPPHRWRLDAHAMTDVAAVAIDGVRLRGRLAEDPPFGHVVTQRVAALVVSRLRHAREQLAMVHEP